jgi:hypothetical protein
MNTFAYLLIPAAYLAGVFARAIIKRVQRRTAPVSEPLILPTESLLWWQEDLLQMLPADAQLVGPGCQLIADTPAAYSCPRCGGWHNVELHQYLHKPTQKIVALLFHDCPAPAEKCTETLAQQPTQIGGEL